MKSIRILAACLFLVVGMVGLTNAESPDNELEYRLVLLNKMIDETNFIVANQCSGTLIDIKNKLILTNQHCIDDFLTSVERDEVQPDGTIKKVKREIRKEVKVQQKTYRDYRQVGMAEYLAVILLHDRKKDLALLQIQADSIPHTQESKLLPDGRKLQRGQRLYIVGNPGMLDASFVEGVISSTNRTIEWSPDQISRYFQFSGGVFGGNSGGAAYDEAMYLIGVPSAGNRAAPFIGFAIPIDFVRDWLKSECWAEIWDAEAKKFKECASEKKESKKVDAQ